MPVVTIQLFEGRTVEQKREIAKAITDTLVTVGKTTPDAVHIVFQEIARHNWAHAGKLASES